MKLKYQIGGTLPLGGSNKSNRFVSNGITSIPEVTVKGIDRRWRLSTRELNHNNGHGVKTQYFYDYYDGGNHYLGDNAVIKGGRTIYTSPKGNDTLYWNNPSDWLWYKSGLMPIGTNQSGAKRNFFKNLKRPLVKEQLGGTLEYQEGGQFKENLDPPSRGFLGEMKTNLLQGNEIFGRMMGSVPMQTLLAGIGTGVAGIAGPAVRLGKDIRYALGSKRGFANTTRKISRNLNARKGNPEFQWVRTSGDIKRGGFTDRAFNGMGNSAQRTVSSASRSEGSGYSAQPILNNNPVYQQARRTPESVAGRRLNHARATEQGYTSSNRVFLRNKLIDRARDWRNWIFE